MFWGFVAFILLTQLSAPAQGYIAYASISPDGMWVIQEQRYDRPYGRSTIQLVHLTSQRQITIETDAVLPPRLLETKLFMWSPDSQFVAYRVFDRQANPSEDSLRVYDVQRSTLLTISPHGYRDAVWLSNHQLGIVTTNETGESWFNLYTVGETNASQIFFLAEYGVCGLSLSPDSRYLSFLSACETLHITERPKEIYLANIAMGEVFPITDFTDEPIAFTIQDAQYDTYWLDKSRLQILVSYRMWNRRGSATVVYNVVTGSFDSFNDIPAPQAPSVPTFVYVIPIGNTAMIWGLCVQTCSGIIGQVSGKPSEQFVNAVTSQDRRYTRFEFEDTVTRTSTNYYYLWETREVQTEPPLGAIFDQAPSDTIYLSPDGLYRADWIYPPDSSQTYDLMIWHIEHGKTVNRVDLLGEIIPLGWQYTFQW